MDEFRDPTAERLATLELVVAHLLAHVERLDPGAVVGLEAYMPGGRLAGVAGIHPARVEFLHGQAVKYREVLNDRPASPV